MSSYSLLWHTLFEKWKKSRYKPPYQRDKQAAVVAAAAAVTATTAGVDITKSPLVSPRLLKRYGEILNSWIFMDSIDMCAYLH